MNKFFKDIEDQYDDKLGFETKINELNKIKRKIEQGIPSYRFTLQTQVVAITNLSYL